jgi:hypothetical protein
MMSTPPADQTSNPIWLMVGAAAVFFAVAAAFLASG